ncbi:MAG: hypothetical protein P857_820 [Candidatus Xenolissoclinum pacificiensis L6]|uniref:Insertion element IS402-like domain-containing protein n=1 Tax=Candidatus Xenolissoclinum pacificiensis L6 TaxID=1401685 RepID=W2V0M4_9RICK|nr:MAG: hypothetical protein P857_820 [Candidatus Xenolissoclinum pacificiensis L6]
MYRHSLSEEIWRTIKQQIPGDKGKVGRPAIDNRLFIDAVLWILYTGSSWRKLPAELGYWKHVHRRFCRWRDKGRWEIVLDILLQNDQYSWMISNKNQEWPWMRMICSNAPLIKTIPRIYRTLGR